MAAISAGLVLNAHAQASLRSHIAANGPGSPSSEPSQLASVKFISGTKPITNYKQSSVRGKQSRRFSAPQRKWMAAVGSPGLADEQDQGRQGQTDLPPVPSGTMMVPMMKKGYGAFGGATLEKSKLDLSYSTSKAGPQVDLGGGGGNVGKGNFHGGGDGGDDGGDDDDYFGGDEGDDGDDDGFIRRGIIGEVFDRASVEAVLQEWFKTIKDLPAGIRRAVEMGLVSSAQVARFMSFDARPTLARIVSRMTPAEISRAFIGRMMADPAFIYKFVLEQAATIGTATWWEVKQRGDRLKDEWSLAVTNVLTLAVCNAAVVWSLSPTRSYGSTANTEWQMALQKLPNNMFDKSYPLREFTMPTRAGSFFYNAAKLSLVGSVVGGVGGLVSNSLLAYKKKRDENFNPSLPVPKTSTSIAAYGAYMGLSGNLRYQLVYGADRVLQQHFNNIPIAILASTALRFGNVLLGEPSRLMWLGLDKETATQTEAQQKAYRRPSRSSVQKGKKSSLGSLLQKLPFARSEGSQPEGRRKPSRKPAQTQSGTAESSTEAAATRVTKRKVKRKVALAQ